MSGFKLLGIRPLLACDDKFSKILEKGTVYRFFNNYHFEDSDGNHIKGNQEVDTVKYDPSASDQLYNIESGDPNSFINVNVSAVVGKNGSGKSTLIELLLLTKYHLGCLFGLLEKGKGLYYYNEIKGEFAIEIFFAKNDTLYILKVDNKKVYFDKYTFIDRKVSLLNDRDPQELLKKDYQQLADIFYSIVLNYSVYGLNDLTIGKWINPLFHKNDGYRTPIVLNPMRENGNYDINKEEYLNKQRLLSNLIMKNVKNSLDNNLTDELKVDKLQFFFQKDWFTRNEKEQKKILDKYSISQEQYDYIKNELKSFLKSKKNPQKENSYKEELTTYLTEKAIKIAHKYPEFKILSLFEVANKTSWNAFFKHLEWDQTHITFKFRQALNFISSGILDETDNRKWNASTNGDGILIYEISLTDISKLVFAAAKQKFNDVIYFLPPPLFSSDLIISSTNNINKSEFKFSSLSSGESQLVAALQTCYYHILNLESIHWTDSIFITTKRAQPSHENRIKYHNVNIIFDEIELYFHPDYQRKFIDKFISGLKLLPLEKIKQFNVVFSTHSPFILSDIPMSNILRLEVDSSGRSKQIVTEQETFGANIHDLLANDFFLENGFMGQYSKNKINESIEFLYFHSLKKELKELLEIDTSKVSDKEKERIKKRVSMLKDYTADSMAPKNNDFKYHKKIIDLIGEPVLREKLLNTYDFLSPEDERERLKARIEKMIADSGIKDLKLEP